MKVVLVQVRRRGERRLNRVHAEVDGQRVGYRSEADRRWSCMACGVRAHATCQHVAAVRRAVKEGSP